MPIIAVIIISDPRPRKGWTSPHKLPLVRRKKKRRTGLTVHLGQ